jgi:phosphoenolpyruvate carboxylase
MAQKDLLKATHAQQIVTELSNEQILYISENQDRVVADRLRNMRDAIWGKVQVAGDNFFVEPNPKTTEEKEKRRQTIENAFVEAVDGLTPAQQELLISSYAKMGHLYEISAISARSNYFKQVKADPRDRAVAFGGIEEFIYNNEEDAKSKPSVKKMELKDWIEKLNQPVFEMIFTAHPTNVNSLESMRAQRMISKAMEDGDRVALKEAIANYQKTPLVPQKDGKDVNLTVRDETDNTLYFLGNIYEDLPRSYQQFDDALSEKAKRDKVVYNPTSLDLKTKFGAWGSSGDKDGNKNVTAETTLEAIALHTKAALDNYRKDLEDINYPELHGWKVKLAEKNVLLEPVLKEIEQLTKDAKDTRDGKASVSPTDLNARFDDLSQKLVQIRADLDAKKFTDAIEQSYNERKDQKTLDLLRRARTFGFNFGKIEYRETAEEYARVVGELVAKQVPDYYKLSPDEKVGVLTRLLQEPENVAAKTLASMAEEITQKGAGVGYSDKSVLPITYHSIKRMALARDFPDMIQDNVLAECGQLPDGVKADEDGKNIASQGVANLLEAQFLQRAVEDKNGKRAKLGIVPLFEEPSTMEHIEKIMGAAYQNDAYKNQLEVMKQERGRGNLVQQVQIAHSDNARRSGLQAARAYIHEAHNKMRKLGQDLGVETEFFEGGSVSDAYRNGVRAISANVNSFGLHNFTKLTFQGGDLLNYFNHPDSTSRLFYRQLSHQASWLEKTPDGTWRAVEPEKTVAESQSHIRQKDNKPNFVMDEVAVQALKAMLHDYQKNDFTQDKMGVLLGVLDYDNEVANSNISSRAGKRNVVEKVADAIADGVEKIVGAVKEIFQIEPVKIDKVRTIGFSKAFQNNGIVPSWIGSKELRSELEKITQERYNIIARKNEMTSDERVFYEAVKPTTMDDGRVHLTPTLLKQFYNKSNTFRDAQDRAVFALGLSDMNAAEKIVAKKLEQAAANDSNSQLAIDYFKRVKDTFEAAASLAYESVTGKEFIAPQTQNCQERNNEIESQIVKALPNLGGEFERKKNYGDFILWLRSEKPEIFKDQHLARMAICAGDTVNHGRWLGASDQTYIQSRRSQLA